MILDLTWVLWIVLILAALAGNWLLALLMLILIVASRR